MGDFHYITNYFQGATSTATANNPLSVRFHPSLDANMMGASGGWTTHDTNTWGTNVYGLAYVDAEKYMLDSTRVKLSITQRSENGRIRISIANPKGNAMTNNTRLYQWNHNINEMQNVHDWDVKYTKYFKFDDPILTGGTETTVNQRVKTLEFTLPYRNWFRSKTGTAATSAAHWDSCGWNDQFYIVIDSDDAINLDGEDLNVEMRMMHTFYKAIS
jgi:hypothetical protein